MRQLSSERSAIRTWTSTGIPGTREKRLAAAAAGLASEVAATSSSPFAEGGAPAGQSRTIISSTTEIRAGMSGARQKKPFLAMVNRFVAFPLPEVQEPICQMRAPRRVNGAVSMTNAACGKAGCRALPVPALPPPHPAAVDAALTRKDVYTSFDAACACKTMSRAFRRFSAIAPISSLPSASNASHSPFHQPTVTLAPEPNL